MLPSFIEQWDALSPIIFEYIIKFGFCCSPVWHCKFCNETSISEFSFHMVDILVLKNVLWVILYSVWPTQSQKTEMNHRLSYTISLGCILWKHLFLQVFDAHSEKKYTSTVPVNRNVPCVISYLWCGIKWGVTFLSNSHLIIFKESASYTFCHGGQKM